MPLLPDESRTALAHIHKSLSEGNQLTLRNVYTMVETNSIDPDLTIQRLILNGNEAILNLLAPHKDAAK